MPFVKWLPPAGRVLVLAAHPDDETLGCGGALILHRKRGDPVRVIIVSDGNAGDPGNLNAVPNLALLRQREARAAAKKLGVRELEFWNYPDSALSGHCGLTDRLINLFKDHKPRLLYRPAADDPHPDHRALGRAVERALRRVKPRLLDCRYEIAGSPRPTAVLDISRDFPQKIKALAAYHSQHAYLDFPRRISRLNAGRGLFLKNSLYAEGYRIKKIN